VRGVAEALATMNGPIILVANLLTEGRGMAGFTRPPMPVTRNRRSHSAAVLT